MIEVNSNWRMLTDEMCVTLQKKSVVEIVKDGVKTGETKEVWNNYGYHKDIKQAMNWLVRSEIHVCNGLEEMVKKIDSLEELINSLSWRLKNEYNS